MTLQYLVWGYVLATASGRECCAWCDNFCHAPSISGTTYRLLKLLGQLNPLTPWDVDEKSCAEMCGGLPCVRTGVPADHPGRSKYIFLLSHQNWTQSKHICKRMGAQLVSIETEEEQGLLEQIMESNKCVLSEEMRRTPWLCYWTSGYGKMFNFKWHGSDKDLTYANWASFQPDGFAWYDTGICVFTENFQWDNTLPFAEKPAICEIRF